MGHNNTDPAVCFYVVLFSGFLAFGKEAVECDFTIKSPVWPHFTSIAFKYVGSCCRDSQQTQDIQLIFAEAGRMGTACSEGCSQSPRNKDGRHLDTSSHCEEAWRGATAPDSEQQRLVCQSGRFSCFLWRQQLIQTKLINDHQRSDYSHNKPFHIVPPVCP